MGYGPWNPSEDHSHYNFMDVSLNENQLCAGLPSTTNLTLPFTGKYEEDFGGPLICLEKSTQKPIFTGVASSNSLSTKIGHPGMIQKIFCRFTWGASTHVVTHFYQLDPPVIGLQSKPRDIYQAKWPLEIVF